MQRANGKYQLETARTEKKSKAHAVRLQSEQKTDGKAEDVPDTPNKGTPKPKAKAEEEASVDEGQTEAEELLAETKAELKRSEEAFERSQISEEAAWQEKQQLERTMQVHRRVSPFRLLARLIADGAKACSFAWEQNQAYTPRPTHTKEEPVKTIILKAGQPTADRVAALEAELLRQNQQLQQLTADLDYHKALVASNDNQVRAAKTQGPMGIMHSPSLRHQLHSIPECLSSNSFTVSMRVRPPIVIYL
jgi:hypothetical protein